MTSSSNPAGLSPRGIHGQQVNVAPKVNSWRRGRLQHSAPPHLTFASSTAARLAASRDAAKTRCRRDAEQSPTARSAATAAVPKVEVCVDTSKARSNLDVVRLCVNELGWKEYPNGRRDGEHCDIYWHGVHFNETPHLTNGKVNKFPGMLEAVRKVPLGRSLDLLRYVFPDEYSFHPRSWFLPQQFLEFCDAVRHTTTTDSTPTITKPPPNGIMGRDAAVSQRREREQQLEQLMIVQSSQPLTTSSQAVFIVKPDEGSQGEGIYLIQEPREYLFVSDRRHIVQEYISSPLLIDTLKFDLRVYVVITSIEPLEIYMARDGIARFCTVAYQHPNNRNIHSAYMHLTNYSLNKRSRNYLHTESEEDGSKRTIRGVFRRLKRLGYDVDSIWLEIGRLAVKTIIAILPDLKVEYEVEISSSCSGISCFQILGFDILLKSDGMPMLLEVNASPSMRLDYEQQMSPGVVECVQSPVDEEIKKPLVLDTLLLVAPRIRTRTCSAARQRKTTAASEPIPTPTTPIGRCWSGPSLSGLAAAADRETPAQPTTTPPPAAAADDGSDIELLPEPTHRGFGSLQMIYPRGCQDADRLRVFERAADIFLECVSGTRSPLKMNSQTFRSFVRKCRLCGSGTGSTGGQSFGWFDILFIELSRRSDGGVSNGSLPGLSVHGFMEATLAIAKKRCTPTETLDQSLHRLLTGCRAALEDERRRTVSVPRLAARRRVCASLKTRHSAVDVVSSPRHPASTAPVGLRSTQRSASSGALVGRAGQTSDRRRLDYRQFSPDTPPTTARTPAFIGCRNERVSTTTER